MWESRKGRGQASARDTHLTLHMEVPPRPRAPQDLGQHWENILEEPAGSQFAQAPSHDILTMVTSAQGGKR